MKILEAQSAVLTNFEVYQHLKSIKHSGRKGKPGNLNNIVMEVLAYLEEAPSPFATKPCPYNNETIKTLLERIRPYNLTKAEIVMILNHRPLKLENLASIIEEIELRMPDENVQWTLLDIITEVLGSQDPDEIRQTMTNNTEKARIQQQDKIKQEGMVLD